MTTPPTTTRASWIGEEKVADSSTPLLAALEAADGEATRVDDIVDVAFNDAHAIRSPTLERALRRYLCEFVRGRGGCDLIGQSPDCLFFATRDNRLNLY